MDHKFTEQIKAWLDTPDNERDYGLGAVYLLKLSGNQILYRTLMVNPAGKKEHIEYQLQKYYNFRVRELTHDQVAEMSAQAERIVAKNIPLAANADKARKGKRPDHDSLPAEIIARYEENLSILHRMREVHMRLRNLSLDNATCPDSERYPFVREIIELDKRLHDNWAAYDGYIPEPVADGAQPSGSASARTSRKSTRKTAKTSAG